MTCRCCGRKSPGPLPVDAIAFIAAPKERATLGGETEDLCLRCQMWAATLAGIIERSHALDLMETLASWR